MNNYKVKFKKKERSEAKKDLIFYVVCMCITVIAGIILTHNMLNPYKYNQIQDVQQYVYNNISQGKNEDDVVIDGDTVCRMEKENNLVTYYYNGRIRTLVYEIDSNGNIQYKGLGTNLKITADLLVSIFVWGIAIIFAFDLPEQIRKYTDELYLEKKLHK